MKKLFNLLSVAILVALLVLSLSNDLFAQRGKPPHGGGRQHQGFGQQHGGFWAELDEEQKQALQQKIGELRTSGASREEIHAAVVEMLQSWGIETPERPGESPRGKRFGKGRDGIFSQLTEDQKKELREKMGELRAQNVSPEEVQNAIKELLDSWGIEVPENFGHRMGSRRMQRGGFMQQLTEEQRQAVHEKIQNLRAQDVPREEITTTIAELLESWGIDVPENFGERFGKRGPRGNPLFDQLSDEQRKAIQDKIHELRSQEVPREEIAVAIAELLESWDVEIPEDFIENFGKHGSRFPFPRIWQQLTEDQKQVIKDLTDSMKENGATRREIHQAVREKLGEFGFDLPERGKEKKPGQQGHDRHGKRENPGKGQINAKNFPNPFNPDTNIQYRLQNPEYVSLKIFNMQGQLIRTLISESLGTGNYSVKWDGTNDVGEKVVSGVYVYKLNVGKDTFSEKLMLMK
jgi:DNA-binding transcriptional regulator YhcF (GntR family)